MRGTAIVKVKRIDCALVGQPDHQCNKAGVVYVAACGDCGWSAQEHIRVILDNPYTGLVQQHRASCPAMAARRAS